MKLGMVVAMQYPSIDYSMQRLSKLIANYEDDR